MTGHPNKRGAAKKAKHQAQIAEMYLEKNMNQRQIAKALGISASTVNRDLKAIMLEWRKREVKTTGNALEAELKLQRELRRKLIDSYDRSIGEKVTTTTSSGSSGDKEEGWRRAEIKKEMSEGEVKYLEAAIKYTDRICKLMGWDKPEGFVITPENLLILASRGTRPNEVSEVFNRMIAEMAMSEADNDAT